MAHIPFRHYLQKTEDALTTGHIDIALARCQHLLAQFPDTLQAQRFLGEIYLTQGRLGEAQQTFDWILVHDPENIAAYCDRALVCERMSHFDAALDCYQQAYELSHGNNQIRQKFNQLSAQIGQPGFMFSRAGLARLYMHGDLLLQAIQEWDIILAVTPDRLDARTGLLETYWRDGLYQRVEQLATQILQEVPGCLKALILLGYVSSVKNMRYAQELHKQAETFDPEMVMGHELFSDLKISQPNDPFLALFRKETLFVKDIETQIAVPANASPSTQENSDIVIQPQQQYQPLQETPTFVAWSAGQTTLTETRASAMTSQIADTRELTAARRDSPAPPAWLGTLTKEDHVQQSKEEKEPSPTFFGPEWLKSLGAASIESTHSTLENLENDLRLQGFIPIAPGSLATMRQETTALQESQRPEVLSRERIETGPLHTDTSALENESKPVQTSAVPLSPELESTQILVQQRSVPENDLETTMRRPALQLQALAQESITDYATTPRDREKPPESPANYQERLLKGYQYQLAGASDDAMEEYRMIIRNAPELLGEVVSNTRALLKLAPTYSAGYRILGDAYMHQGEYLQAMEAYNKALALTKKTKS